MDDKTYLLACAIQEEIQTMNSCRNGVLRNFDNLAASVPSITDGEFINMLASMRSTLDRYFDGQIAPLEKQFKGL